MTTVKAVDLSGNEVIIENVKEVSQSMGDIDFYVERCGLSPFFGLIQCPDCRDTPDKTCGKYFAYRRVRTNPDLIEVDGKPVKEIIEIV